MPKAKASVNVARSSVTGQFVTKKYAAGHKKTTEVEAMKRSGGKKKS